jgi:hypothetical protein
MITAALHSKAFRTSIRISESAIWRSSKITRLQTYSGRNRLKTTLLFPGERQHNNTVRIWCQ